MEYEQNNQEIQEEENHITSEELENELKLHMNMVTELQELLYKRRRDLSLDTSAIRIEAVEPESIGIQVNESLDNSNKECPPANDMDTQTNQTITVHEFNTTVETCVMVDYSQKLFEGWLGVEESKRASQGKRSKWMFLWATLDCNQLVLKTDPGSDDEEIFKVIDVGRIVSLQLTQPDSFGWEESRLSQVVHIKYYDDASGLSPSSSPSASNTTIFSENPPNWSGHDFHDVTFRLPKKCNYCMDKLNNIISPPSAYECRKCHLKIHKEHANEPDLNNCSIPNKIKEIRLMAPIQTKWGNWVKKLEGVIVQKKEETNNCNKSSCPLTHDSTLMD